MQRNGIGFVSPCLSPCNPARLGFRFVSLDQQANQIIKKDEVLFHMKSMNLQELF